MWVLLFIPEIIAFVAWALDSLWISVAALLSVLIVVALTPVCKYRESLWVAILVSVTGIPLDLIIAHNVAVYVTTDFTDSSVIFWAIYIVSFLISFSMQENVMVLISRFIWKRQKKLLLNDYSNIR